MIIKNYLKLNNKNSWLILIILISIFSAIVLNGLNELRAGDENKWYYFGYLVQQGELPYRNFFYAQPPFQLLTLSIIFSIFGFNIVILKSVPFLSTIASTIILFLIVKKRYGNIPALISSTIYLFTYSILFNSVFSFGVSLATALLLFGYLLYGKKYFFLSGLIFGIASMTRLLVLIPIGVTFVWILLKHKKKILNFTAGFALSSILPNLFLLILFGKNYFIPVYWFHLNKASVPSLIFSEYSGIIQLNLILFLALGLFIGIYFKNFLTLPFIIVFTFLISLFFVKRLYGYYFLIVIPFMALLGGISIYKLIKFVSSKNKIIGNLLCLILGIFFIWTVASNTLFLNKIGFVGLERHDSMVDYIDSRFDKDIELFGDDSITPLIALLTERRIVNNIVDTNDAIFESNVLSIGIILDQIRDKEFIFIARTTQGIAKFKEVREFLNNDCTFLTQFREKFEGDFLLYKC